MSICQMTAVWNQSASAANDLLLMLALADSANDDGYCWPSIQTLCKKTRLSKATVIRRMAELEAAGEVFIYHNRRRGNRYLITLSLAVERVAELKEQYFGQDALSTNMKPKKYQNDTSRSRKVRHEKSHADTSEVSPVIHDPSRTVIEPSSDPSKTKDSGAMPTAPITADPPAQARPETTPKKKRARAVKPKTEKTTTPRAPDIVFDTIAERAFCAPPGDPAVEEVAGRVGKIRAALKRIGCTLLEFTAACDAYERQGLTPGRTPETAVTMVQEYRQEHKPGNGTAGPSKIITADGAKTPEEASAAIERTRRSLACQTATA